MEIATITRATPADFDAAWGIVNEYYDAVNVLIRETPDSFSLTISAKAPDCGSLG
jgi:hypothetical protein